MEEESKQLLKKFRKMKELEKERDKAREILKELNLKVCQMQNEMNEIIESDTMRF